MDGTTLNSKEKDFHKDTKKYYSLQREFHEEAIEREKKTFLVETRRNI